MDSLAANFLPSRSGPTSNIVIQSIQILSEEERLILDKPILSRLQYFHIKQIRNQFNVSHVVMLFTFFLALEDGSWLVWLEVDLYAQISG